MNKKKSTTKIWPCCYACNCPNCEATNTYADLDFNEIGEIDIECYNCDHKFIAKNDEIKYKGALQNILDAIEFEEGSGPKLNMTPAILTSIDQAKRILEES